MIRFAILTSFSCLLFLTASSLQAQHENRMMYGYLQKGLDEKAAEVLDELLSIDNFQPHFGEAYGVAAAHARYYLERRVWEVAAQLYQREQNPLRISRFQ